MLQNIVSFFKEKNTTEVVRLNREVYAALEKQVGGIAVGQNTTELQVSYQLGVQAVLKHLREGYVIDR